LWLTTACSDELSTAEEEVSASTQERTHLKDEIVQTETAIVSKQQALVEVTGKLDICMSLAAGALALVFWHSLDPVAACQINGGFVAALSISCRRWRNSGYNYATLW